MILIIKMILKKIKKNIILLNEQVKWQKRNKNNFTSMNNHFPCNVVQVGNYTYGKLNVHYYKNNNEFLKIGNYCSIADNVHFFLAGEHDYKNLLTFPLKNYISKNKIKESITKGPIIVEDDVWIGYGSIILSGVKIGKGCVIGAGSIVTKDIEPYSIYVGNKVIKKRFDNEIIKKLIGLDYSKLSFEECKQNLDEFYKNIDKENINEILHKLNNINKGD